MDTGDSKRKVLYVITMSGGGGATRYVYDLATNLPADFEPVVAAGSEGGCKLLQTVAAAGVRTIELKHLKRAVRPLQDRKAKHELRELFQAEQPYIIHLNSTKAAVLGSLAAKHNFHIVYTAHGWVFKEDVPWYKKCVYRAVEKFCSGYYEKVIVLSEADHADGLKLGLHAGDLHLIRNGMRPLQFLPREEARQRVESILQVDLTGKQLIYGMALFFETKGLKYLVEAIKQLADLPCIAVVFGDGHLRGQLETQISALGLQDRIYLPGYHDEAASFIKAADVFVLPSIKEGLPYAILESMQAQVPIVATKVGGIPEILEHSLVSPGNSAQLAKAIREQLTHPRLPQNRPPVFEEMVRKTIDCYRSLS